MSQSPRWSPTDPKHFEGKTLRQLQHDLTQSESFAKVHPEFVTGWHNEYVQELRRRIAEQIGRKAP